MAILKSTESLFCDHLLDLFKSQLLIVFYHLSIEKALVSDGLSVGPLVVSKDMLTEAREFIAEELLNSCTIGSWVVWRVNLRQKHDH